MSFSSDSLVVMTIEHNLSSCNNKTWKVEDKSKTVWGVTATTSIPTRTGVLYNYIQDAI